MVQTTLTYLGVEDSDEPEVAVQLMLHRHTETLTDGTKGRVDTL